MRKAIGAVVLAISGLALPAGAQEESRGAKQVRIQQRELDQLHQYIQALERRNAELEARLKALSPGEGEEPGVGGAGEAVASATFYGIVSDVSEEQVAVIDQDGQRYDLRIDKRTRVFRDDRPFALDGLVEGTPVQASFDLIAGDTYARRLEVLAVP